MGLTLGPGISSSQVSTSLSQVSVQLRDTMRTIYNLYTFVNGGGNGLAVLEQLGFGSTADDNNPGDISDAQYALNMINYLGSVMNLYYGEATQPTAFDFDTELSILWCGA
jgi:hypothetical protein